ncbi:MAG: hypothetical protein GYB53_05955 [Rhodobacteraceae bacterium]|nr:hypothetical protein [Paracoccaceae bacterium]MBR9820133.1 hypothetical protein [Paracoccaceae bacterium]
MTPIVINIDVEPVQRVVRGQTPDWDGFEELIALMMERRPRLEDASGAPVAFNWNLRMDPQIEVGYGRADWVFHRYGREIQRLLEAGDTLGLHIHTWRPVRRFFRNTWLAEFDDVDWISHCVQLSFDTFRANLDRTPTSMSFGDNFMHSCAIPIMEENGVRADMSMSPGRPPVGPNAKGELANGVTPDYRQTPRHPFKPSAADFTRPGPSNYGFWEIPITSGIVGKTRKGDDHWSKLLFGIRPEWIETLITGALEAAAPVIAGDCRTDVLTNEKNRERFIWSMDYLEKMARTHDLRFSRLDHICDQLDSGALESGR